MHLPHLTLRTLTLLAAPAALPAVAPAAVIIDQTSTNENFALLSDRNDDSIDGLPGQIADGFTLATTATPTTARSATWRGVFGTGGVTTPTVPVGPFSFDLIFYADDGTGRPDPANVLSDTTVTFTSVNDVAITTPSVAGLYEFSADLDPITLPAGEQVWFSVLAETTADTTNDFFWTVDDLTNPSNELAARRDILPFAQFGVIPTGDASFTLNTVAIPEPTAALGVTSMLGLAALRRRRV
jgi:hypothetical protein